ncbi:normocyte-binding protein [Clostridium sp. YIM B02555]|uniref:normocyte-binding protein n=1 Tax=Clostridium sp. YIM B02555 TaxID=2911968 RepID=UPI001EEF77B2|nr:normocyte-binding protein [Clostridium sp. YIM B02555]
MRLVDIDLIDIYRKWKKGLGPFQCYFRSSSFVSLQTYEDFLLNDENNIEFNKELLQGILESSKERTFIIVDLPLKEILDLALMLNNDYNIKPLLNINLLFHSFGIVGDKKDISKLIINGLKLKDINSKKIVMLIPFNRYEDGLENSYLKDHLNNQYGIGEDDLPSLEILKEFKYSKLIIFTKDKIKKDLEEYINFINKHITVEIIKVRE